MNVSLFIAALTFMITMYITPGPNNILCAVHGSQYGIRRTVPLISGMAFGWLIMGLFVAVTLEIIEGYKDILSYLTYIGACYIAFLSYHIATSKPIEDENDESQNTNDLKAPGTPEIVGTKGMRTYVPKLSR